VATLAQVYLSSGVHGDKRLLSPKIIAEATRVHTQWGGLGWQIEQPEVGDYGFWRSSQTGNVVWVDPTRRLILSLLTAPKSQRTNTGPLKSGVSMWSQLVLDISVIIDQAAE
jgi:hypothetical protein